MPAILPVLRADHSLNVGPPPRLDSVAYSEPSQRDLMPSFASGTPFLDVSGQSEWVHPAAPLELPAGSTAIVYCEGQFGQQDGKTANGLVRHSEKYDILSVIDSRRAGVDAAHAASFAQARARWLITFFTASPSSA